MGIGSAPAVGERPAPVSPRFLSGLRALEIGASIAGAFCGKILAALGAEVIKVEPPEGDRFRRLGPFSGDRPEIEGSLLFLYLNTGKMGITLEPGSATGGELFGRLVAGADVILDSLGPGRLAALGFAYPKLAELAPGLVLTSISDFGAGGPYRDFRGGELVVMALGGLMHMIGDPQREPLRLGGYQVQYATALSAFVGTMAALHHRDNTGRGQQVEVSAQETVAFIEWKSGIYYQAGGQLRRRGGSGQWMVLPCKDGFVAFVYQNKNWPAVVELLKDERLTEPRFATLASRVKHREELRSILESWTKPRPKLEIYHEAQAKGIPVGMVADMADVVASPQYAATAFLAAIDHPSTGPVQYPSFPCSIDGERSSVGRAPLLGEHSLTIYRDRLGLTTADVLRLREASVI